MSRLPTLAALGICATTFAGCTGAMTTTEVAGSCADAYGADICTWATMADDRVASIGATIPMASIEGAPAQMAMAWPPPVTAALALPSSAASQGVTHMTMYWEPMGHGPATFLTPHFDFHFYLIPESRRVAIDCADLSKPTNTPAGYGLRDEPLPPELAALAGLDVLIGSCIPEMGMHSVRLVEAETDRLFDGTIIVGYYQGEPIFVEPMIAQAYLKRRQSFELSVPSIPGADGAPTTFAATYDADADAYRFEFSGFAQAQ